jgi:hypothetical protein
MSNKALNLNTYTIQNIRKDMVECFDSDYNGDNGDEYWELSEEKNKKGEYKTLAKVGGFKTEAERFITEIYDEETDDVDNIESILAKVEECWGSQAEQFQFSVHSCHDEYGEDAYVVAISFLT